MSGNCFRFSRTPLSYRVKTNCRFESVSWEATDRLIPSDTLHTPGTQEPSKVGLLQPCPSAQASELYSWCCAKLIFLKQVDKKTFIVSGVINWRVEGHLTRSCVLTGSAGYPWQQTPRQCFLQRMSVSLLFCFIWVCHASCGYFLKF